MLWVRFSFHSDIVVHRCFGTHTPSALLVHSFVQDNLNTMPEKSIAITQQQQQQNQHSNGVTSALHIPLRHRVLSLTSLVDIIYLIKFEHTFFSSSLLFTSDDDIVWLPLYHYLALSHPAISLMRNCELRSSCS